MINISGLNKAEVLKALYDHSHVQGMGILQTVPHGYVTVEHCQMLLETTGYPYFDYLYGRVLKVDLSGDSFDERLYDRDCGPGAAARAIEKLRSGGKKAKKEFGEMFVNTVGSGIQIREDRFCDAFVIRFDGVEAVDKLIHMCEALKHKMNKED